MTAPDFLAALRAQAQLRGDKAAMKFMARGEEVTETIAYAELHAAAAAIAVGLAEAALAGKVVALAMPPGTQATVAFIGVMMAGAVAMILPFPATAQNADRIARLLEDARPAAVIAETEASPLPWPADVPKRALRFDALLAGSASAAPPHPGRDQPAFLQYSSGSTGAPSGIVITHGNLAANLAMIRAGFEHDDRLVGVNWLPPSHDMGLVGAVLQSLYVGGTTCLMPPQAFMMRPSRWVEAISTHRATTAGGPNFGYDLCCRRVSPDQLRELDLSSWSVAFCGAEPIRAGTLNRFAAHFAAAGFAASAFMPCYGLAEATLMVASRPKGSGMRLVSTADTDWPQVSSGPVARGGSVHILSATGEALTQGPGAIHIAGPHVSPGLWDGRTRQVRPFPDERTDAQGGRLVPTGDVGVWDQGELVVTGRSKDICIVNGRKIHASDIEAGVLEQPRFLAVQAMAAVARIGPGAESLLLLCEVDLRRGAVDAAALGKEISAFVAAHHGILPQIAFLPRGGLPRTNSGKVRRQHALQQFLEGTLPTQTVRLVQGAAALP